MKSRMLVFKPPRIAMAFILLAVALHLATPLGQIQIVAIPVAGTLVATAGFLIMLRAWWQFKMNHVAVCPTSATARLITSGIYRFTRNPMYLGMTMMLLGLALWLGSAPFFAAAAAFAFVINQAFCRFEEAKLVRLFGAEYEDYKRSVRRWI